MKRTDARIFTFTMMALVCAMLFFAAICGRKAGAIVAAAAYDLSRH